MQKNTGLVQFTGPDDPRIKELKTLGTVTMNHYGWRKGTKETIWPASFIFTGGGLGDYINQIVALEWLAETQPHIHGKVFAAEPTFSVFKYIMGKYKHWKVYEPSQITEKIGKEATLSPSAYVKYIDAVGAHLMDLGFMLYAKRSTPPPNYKRLPDLSGYKSGKFKEWGLPERYAVITPNYTVPTRLMRGVYINELSKYLKEKHDITPVYLGKRDFAQSGKNHKVAAYYKGFVDEAFDPNLGIDLREKTTLLEATEIMGNSMMVMGIDNGLLHYAGCTKAPIIFGHTITEVEHRSIRRPIGETINIIISREQLACSGCQSHMRLLPTHQFRQCYYGDYKCIDMLFGSNCKTWKDAIDHMVELDSPELDGDVE